MSKLHFICLIYRINRIIKINKFGLVVDGVSAQAASLTIVPSQHRSLNGQEHGLDHSAADLGRSAEGDIDMYDLLMMANIYIGQSPS
jgi:hypothetical protein